MNRSTFWMTKYMKGSVFSKARYMIGVDSHTRTKITPKLPPPGGGGGLITRRRAFVTLCLFPQYKEGPFFKRINSERRKAPLSATK